MTATELPVPQNAIGPVTAVHARRIGLIAENHSIREDGGDLPDEVFEAFEGVDAIFHLGHMGWRLDALARGVLDRLASIAPVYAVLDYWTDLDGTQHLTPPDGDRVVHLTRVYDVDGVKVGAAHNLNLPPGPPLPVPHGGVPQFGDVDAAALLRQKFAAPVDVVAFAGSHRAAVAHKQGILFVNPGSPTRPRGPGRVPDGSSLGTVGVLEISGDAVTFELVELAALRDQRSAGRNVTRSGSKVTT
jgi:predicted phosphodiesterase